MSAAAVHEVQPARLALIGSARAGRRMLLDMLLSAKGYEITVCEDGPSVLEFLKENQPVIAVFDHDLPGMDGREICSRMRFITRLAETPIAIVTPTVEEMGGVAEFESFSDTTTADIVEAEPLGKKSLVERLESVIRQQKGAANAGKITIAIPTMVPAIPDMEPAMNVDADEDDLDVFVDDDVDIEVDVARAIYSNDESHELPEPRMPTGNASPVRGAESEEAAAADEAADAPAVQGEEMLLMKTDAEADELLTPADEAEEFDFLPDEVEAGDPANDVEVEWPAAIESEEQEAAGSIATATQDDLTHASSMTGLGEAGEPDDERELVGVAGQPKKTVETAAAGAGEEVETEPVDSHAALAAETDVPEVEDSAGEEARLVVPGEVHAAEAEGDTEPVVLGDEDISATIEAAIEAVNLAAMEEAYYESARTESPKEPESDDHAEEELASAENVDEQAGEVAGSETVDVKSTVEMIVENVETELEPMARSRADAIAAGSGRAETSANNYADAVDEMQIDLASAAAGGSEEGELAVLNEERSNMQALIDEQAERIDNLQQRNVMLRKELEQRRADDALRQEERSNLQALIKEQTEAITNLQQRNVQLRQELDQYRAEETKRESERSFLQAHTSEQAETIAKLQQLNALLRQELEQRKADEAPLRDFLQRLLDRDEQSSAYQEAVRKEIISLGRDNS